MLKVRFISLFVLLLTITLNSCSDEDSFEVTSSNLCGTWTFTRCYGWEYEYDDNNNKYKDYFDEQAEPENVVETFTFNEDGSGVEKNIYKKRTDEYPFRYSIVGNKIIFSGETILVGKDVTVIKLTKKELVLKCEDSESEENRCFTK